MDHSPTVSNADETTWTNTIADHLDDATKGMLRAMSSSILKKLELIQLGMDIHKYAIPPIVILGLLGNILSLVIMHKPFMRARSACVYFSALAVADSIALINHMASYWARQFPGGRSHLIFNDIVCKFLKALFIFGLQCPAWLIVAVAAERFIITSFPLKGKIWCTRRSALIVVVTIWVVCFLYNFLQVAVFGITAGRCDESAFLEYASEYGGWLLFVSYTLIPSPALLILNGTMIYKLAKAQRKRHIITGVAPDHQKSNGVISRATTAAVVVSMTFLILTLPSMALRTVNLMTDLENKYLELVFINYISIIFGNINNAINFIIYLVCYPRIRVEFVAMVTRCFPQPVKQMSSAEVKMSQLQN